MEDYGDKFFGGSYLSPTPSIWANQQLGLVCITNITNHIRGSFQKVSYHPGPGGAIDTGGHDADEDQFSEDNEIADDWKYYDSDFIDGLHELDGTERVPFAVDTHGRHVCAKDLSNELLI